MLRKSPPICYAMERHAEQVKRCHSCLLGFLFSKVDAIWPKWLKGHEQTCKTRCLGLSLKLLFLKQIFKTVYGSHNIPCSVPNGLRVVGYLKFLMVGTLLPFVGLVFDVSKWVSWSGWGLGRRIWEAIWKVWEKYENNNVLTVCFFYLQDLNFKTTSVISQFLGILRSIWKRMWLIILFWSCFLPESSPKFWFVFFLKTLGHVNRCSGFFNWSFKKLMQRVI